MDLLDREMPVEILEPVALHGAAGSDTCIGFDASVEGRSNLLQEFVAIGVIRKRVIGAITQNRADVDIAAHSRKPLRHRRLRAPPAAADVRLLHSRPAPLPAVAGSSPTPSRRSSRARAEPAGRRCSTT